MRSETRKKFIKKLLIIVLVILVFFGLGLLGYKTVSIAILSEIEVNGQSLTCADNSAIADFAKKLSLNYFHFKSENFKVKLIQNFFCIGKIETSVSYPNKLRITMHGRVGAFIVKTINTSLKSNPEIILSEDQLSATQSSTQAFPPKVLNQIIETSRQASASAMFLVDEEGVIFEEVTSDVNFPHLYFFSQELKIGNKISGDQVKKASEVTKKLKELEVFSDNLIIVGERLIVDTTPRIIFSLTKPLDRQTASLQLILSQAKMNPAADRSEKESIESIDLRFDKSVVVYAAKKK